MMKSKLHDMGPNSGISLVLVQNMLTRIHILYIYIWRYENMILVVNRIHSTVVCTDWGFVGHPISCHVAGRKSSNDSNHKLQWCGLNKHPTN